MPDIILGCGARKLKRACPAWRLYQGPVYCAAFAWARSVAPLERIYILSAKYGLITAQTVIEPYNALMGTPSQVCTVRSVAKQAAELGLDRVRPLLVNVGRTYRAVLTLPRFDLLLDYMRLPDNRFGYQMQWFKHNHGYLPRGLFDDASQ